VSDDNVIPLPVKDQEEPSNVVPIRPATQDEVDIDGQTYVID
jgi:hypothetical protein